MGNRLVFQLGTNNWQRDGEFAPGSGILHATHHRALNALPNVRAYSMYPSRVQRFREEDVRVFELDHDIPICESVSPVSSYRWHDMSDAEVTAYRQRLAGEVAGWMAEIEDSTRESFGLAIAHHAFMNTVVLRDVNRSRVAAGRASIPVLCFVHGTELKMYANESRGDRPEEFPLRFLPFMKREGIFDLASPGSGVDAVAAISMEQAETFRSIFPEFPADRVILSPNGYDQTIFRRIVEPDDLHSVRRQLLAQFPPVPPPPSGGDVAERVALPDDVDAVVVFCGKFADWKRLDALLRAAALYEHDRRRIMTLVVGSGPPEAQLQMHEMARDLGLRRTFFLGPQPQDRLATLFNCADVGCFPSYREPFGLVFVECMACGTPVIGADSGGPRDFVTPAVGTLVPETDDRQALAESLAAAVRTAVAEDWKRTKGPAAETYARDTFSVARQVSRLLEEMDRLQATTR